MCSFALEPCWSPIYGFLCESLCSGLCHSESLHIRTSRGVPEQSTRNMPCPDLLWYSKVRIFYLVLLR